MITRANLIFFGLPVIFTTRFQRTQTHTYSQLLLLLLMMVRLPLLFLWWFSVRNSNAQKRICKQPGVLCAERETERENVVCEIVVNLNICMWNNRVRLNADNNDSVVSAHARTRTMYANNDDGEIFYGYLFSYTCSIIQQWCTCGAVGKKVLVVVISQIETSISCKL